MNTSKTRASDTLPPKDHAKRDLLLLVIALLAFVGLSVGLLTLFNPRPRAAEVLDEATLPKGEKALDLTLVHTNDSWGYLEGCG